MERDIDPEDQGVAIALEKICSLESRLRQAIQSTHTLHRSFGQDLGAVDREREALLLIRENLELLEDKLREYRTVAMDPKGYDDKVVALSQLDGLRKDLLRCARDRVDFVLFNKDVVKDILAFSDTGASDEVLQDPVSEPEGYEARDNYTAGHTPASSDADDSDSEMECRPYSHRASPHRGGALHRDSLSLSVPDKDDIFPYPAPASSPSVKAASSQATRDYNHRGLGDLGANSLPNMKSQSVEFRGSKRPPVNPQTSTSDFAAASAASQDYGGAIALRRSSKQNVPRQSGGDLAKPNGAGHSTFASKKLHLKLGGRQHGDLSGDENSLDVIQPRLGRRALQRPPSHVSSSDTPRHEEFMDALQPQGNHDQRRFGGSLSFSKGRAESSNTQSSGKASPAVPLPPTPSRSDRLRVISTSSFSSDDQIRPIRTHVEHADQTDQSSYSESLIQPSRHALSLRTHQMRIEPEVQRQNFVRRKIRGALRKMFAVGDLLKSSFTGVIGIGALIVIAQSLGKSGVPFQLPRLPMKRERNSKSPHLHDLWRLPSLPRIHGRQNQDQMGKPMSDGHLVPEWMHYQKFSSTDEPPVGALTSTPRPPVGEMFPSIPPPTSKYVRG